MKKCFKLVLLCAAFSLNLYSSDSDISTIPDVSDMDEEFNSMPDELNKDTDKTLNNVSVTTKESYTPQEKDVQENFDMQAKIVQKNIQLAQATDKIADLFNSGFIELSDEDKKIVDNLKKSYELNKKSAEAHKIMQEIDSEVLKLYQAGYQPSNDLLKIIAKFNKKIIETSIEASNFMMKVLDFKPIFQG